MADEARREQVGVTERAVLGASVEVVDAVRWRAKWRVEKYHGDYANDAEIAAAGETPYDVIEREGNLLMYGGASNLWQCLIGNGTGTAGQTLTFFNNGNAYIGVGDSTTAAAATQTDLQAATNKDRQPMEATYPQHTDGTTSGSADIVFRSVWGTSEGNFAWQEWGIFNGSTGGRMLNRKVESLGTKTTGTWTLTVTLTAA